MPKFNSRFVLCWHFTLWAFCRLILHYQCIFVNVLCPIYLCVYLRLSGKSSLILWFNSSLILAHFVWPHNCQIRRCSAIRYNHSDRSKLLCILCSLSPDLNLTPLAAFLRFCRAQRSAKNVKKAARGVRFKLGLCAPWEYAQISFFVMFCCS